MKRLHLYYLPIIIAALGLSIALLTSVASAQPPAPHTVDEEVEGRCADCHQAGTDGAPLLPSDHQAHDNEDCRVCHATAGLAAPAISHLVEGWQDCLSCHQEWVPEETPALADSEQDHTGYTSDTCQSCHRPALTLKHSAASLLRVKCITHSSTPPLSPATNWRSWQDGK